MGNSKRWFDRLARLVPSRRRPRAGYLLAVVGHGLLLAGLLTIRDATTPLSKGFALMLVVVLAAVVGGLGPGIFASLLGFVIFNLAFIPPYGTFHVGRAEDAVVLFVFLGLSMLISTILAMESERREAVEAREKELETINDLTRDMVSRAPGDDTYRSALEHLVRLFAYPAAALLLPDPAQHNRLSERVAIGVAPGTIDPTGTPGAGGGTLRVPLIAGSRSVGLLVLAGSRPALSEAENRVLHACCNELALLLERDRLIEVSERADVFRKTDTIRRSLFGAVSHELRSPLAAIKASVTDVLSADGSRSPDYAREVMEAVNSEADRLDGLISNLLDMSRIEAGTLLARVQSADLSDAARRCRDRLERMWPAHSVKISIGEDASMVKADPVFLERILTNLLEKPAKASPKGTIEVTARLQGSQVNARVVDHGKGVPPNDRERVFHPFYELDPKNALLGRGLGLAICKGFLKAMEGDIWLEDTPGGGATFAFSLPAPSGS